MADLKHKDIDFHLPGSARSAKSYEDAVLKAVSKAAISGKTVAITVYAASPAGAKWYDDNFGPPKSALQIYKKLKIGRDDWGKIDTIKIRVT